MWSEEKEKTGKDIMRDLYRHGMIRTWFRDNPRGWVLVSGLWSPFYIQLRPLASHPRLLKKVGRGLGRLVAEECKNVTRIVGVAMAGVPIAAAISVLQGIPSCFTRKLEGVRSLEDFDRFVKGYGEHSIIEGELTDKDVVVIVDDLVTRFDSKLLAIKQLEFEARLRKLKGLVCSDVVVLLDREQGAKQVAKEHGIRLRSLIPFMSMGVKWLRDVLSPQEYAVIREYLKDTKKYQNPKLQSELLQIAVREKRRQDA